MCVCVAVREDLYKCVVVFVNGETSLKGRQNWAEKKRLYNLGCQKHDATPATA